MNVGLSNFLLTVRNRTTFCIISVAVSLTIEDSHTLVNRTLNKTVEFSPALAPGQEQESWLDSKAYFPSGGYENVMGLLKKWDLAEGRGFAAAIQSAPQN